MENLLDDFYTKKNDPKVTRAWAMFDWSNSVYNLVITTAIFPVYYHNVTVDAFKGEIVTFLGFSLPGAALYSYAISFSFLLIAFLSPILSGIADYGGHKKRMMQFFTYMGAMACMGLYFFEGSNIEFGIFCAVLASCGYAGGLVFYNAYLPEIVTEDRLDEVSAQGFSLGYIGSVLLLIVNLVMIEKFDLFGFANKTQAVRSSFFMVGLWWIGFSQWTFNVLPSGERKGAEVSGIMIKGFQELIKVWEKLKSLHSTKRFLLSFLMYSTGVQTIMLLAPTFAKGEIAVSDSGLIIVVLIIQLVAIGGAYLFAWVSNRYGNKLSIAIMLVIWIGICIVAYFIQTEHQFYLLAVAVGMVMGGIQSLSRSTYSKLIPENTPDTASFFSFYDVTEKISIVMGTFSFGLIDQLTHSMRNSAIVLTLFFTVGLLILFTIPEIRNRSKDS